MHRSKEDTIYGVFNENSDDEEGNDDGRNKPSKQISFVSATELAKKKIHQHEGEVGSSENDEDDDTAILEKFRPDEDDEAKVTVKRKVPPGPSLIKQPQVKRQTVCFFKKIYAFLPVYLFTLLFFKYVYQY